MSDFDIGYAMGLLVGEGCFTGDRHHPVCSVRLHSRDPKPLLFLQRMFGGRIYGPYQDGKRTTLVWLLRGNALRRATLLFLFHLPESHKREQFLKWLDRYQLYFFYYRRVKPLPDPRTVDWDLPETTPS
jgi:hypothetical protein